jgi:hypothetical protein
MTFIPLKDLPNPRQKDVRREFERLVAIWEQAVAHHSSESIRTKHPAYQEIIGLGPPVVPHLLSDMECNRRHWFAALIALTGANPVATQDAGKVDKMIESWLQWGRENGYQW